MKENIKEKKRVKRLKNIVMAFIFSTIVLGVTTYAWFVGLQVVNVTAFSIEIASTESLLLSLNGKDWDTTVEISKDTLDEVSYAGHQNKWGGKGLIPMSSVGEVDPDSSRLVLYEKASLTATKGGYRLMASRVPNNERVDGQLVEEVDGYVVFDLFIKNMSGNKYFEELNIADEEAIFLTTDSSAYISENGVEGTGIENSVRVAFAQIGRVNGTASTSTPEKITSITCNPGSNGMPVNLVTGICRRAAIWEPNDTYHVENAIRWYNASCRKRVGFDITKDSAYSSALCNPISDGVSYNTYVINGPISSADKVDVYDGADYNGYTNTTKLEAIDTFTDTDRDKEGVEREPIFTLAPNSITKVRVYIYIEGQDIDNYEYAVLGGSISVSFGFTKQRFVEDDIDYIDPFKKPVIILNGPNPYVIPKTLDGSYSDPGATAEDEHGIDISSDIVIDTSELNTKVPGTYIVRYSVVDDKDRVGTATRTVIVED